MKKIIMILISIMIAGTLSAQVPNTFRYPVTLGMPAPGTVTGGVLNFRGLTSGNVQLKVPAAAGTGTIFQFPANNGTSGYVLKTNGSGVLTWNPAIEAAEQEDAAAIFVKQLQDTVSFTADTKTLALTDAGKIIYCSNANYQEITIPTNGAVAFPVGTVITFINTGPGIIRIEPAATVIRKSVLDSTTMNTVNQTYQIIKRATNKWYFIGDFRD